jgi:hypothetical protein
MIDLTDKDQVRTLQSNLHAVFDTPQGKEAMEFMEMIGHWYPNVTDSNDTNDIIGRDANRKLIGTIKTLLKLSSEQVVAIATQTQEG